jgi:chaperone required for assembly of F1-ATPase
MPDSAPRRFYKTAEAVAAPGGFSVALDGRLLRTPKGEAFIAPTRALVALCAHEWAAQGEHIRPASMPVTQLAFAAIDWTRPDRASRVDYVLSFAGTDLCCHRAEAPAELVARQAQHWDPLVVWAAETLEVRLPVVTGVVAAAIDATALARLRVRAAALDDFRLTALTQACGLAGSALIGYALLENRLDAEAAFAAAALDDLWSLERWGEDEEARARLERLKREIVAAEGFVRALSG